MTKCVCVHRILMMLILGVDDEAAYYISQLSNFLNELFGLTHGLYYIPKLSNRCTRRADNHNGTSATLPNHGLCPCACSMSGRGRGHIWSKSAQKQESAATTRRFFRNLMPSQCPRGDHVSVSGRCLELLHVELRQEEDQAHPRFRMLAVGLRHAILERLMEGHALSVVKGQTARACTCTTRA